MHLNDEQLEDALREPGSHQEHLDQCTDCRTALDNQQETRAVLRNTLGKLSPPDDLEKALRANLAAAAKASAKMKNRWRLLLRPPPVLAAAAALLIALVPLGIYFGTPSTAQAAQKQLADIHNQNLCACSGSCCGANSQEPCLFFRQKLGYSPAMPKKCPDMSVQTHCVARLAGRDAASYLLNTPSGAVSVVITDHPPEELGLERLAGEDKPFWCRQSRRMTFAATKLNGRTYVALADKAVPREQLLEVLRQLEDQDS